MPLSRHGLSCVHADSFLLMCRTVSDGGHYYHLNSEERSQTTKKGKDDFAKNGELTCRDVGSLAHPLPLLVEQVKVLVGKLQEEKKT